MLRSLAARAVSFYCGVKGQKVVLGEAGDSTAHTSRTTWYRYPESDTVSQYIHIYSTHTYTCTINRYILPLSRCLRFYVTSQQN